MNKLNLIFRFSIISVIVYMLIKPGLGNIALKYYGKCSKAVLINETIQLRYQKPLLLYQFNVLDEFYKGNSSIEDLSKSGDSICIVYLNYLPSINRPISFFEEPINCNCK